MAKTSFAELAESMVKLQERKNQDYGSAYYDNLEDEGLGAARIAIGNKFRRFKHLSMPGTDPQVGEKLEDTLIDLAAYALMTAEWLKNKEE